MFQASSSGSLNFVFAKVNNLLKFLILQPVDFLLAYKKKQYRPVQTVHAANQQ
jgi:hypothetical protein